MRISVPPEALDTTRLLLAGAESLKPIVTDVFLGRVPRAIVHAIIGGQVKGSNSALEMITWPWLAVCLTAALILTVTPL